MEQTVTFSQKFVYNPSLLSHNDLKLTEISQRTKTNKRKAMKINCTSTSTPAILADIAKFRDKLSKLEALVARRDEIKSQIAEIDSTLRSVLGDEFMATQERLTIKTKRHRNTEPMINRLKAVCDLYPQGATIQNFVEHMNVKKATAVTYLYMTHKNLVNRAYNAEGKAIWTLKN